VLVKEKRVSSQGWRVEDLKDLCFLTTTKNVSSAGVCILYTTSFGNSAREATTSYNTFEVPASARKGSRAHRDF
jgi:hypothetical protein